MNKDEWESLQGCPGWSALRRYLRDYRERIKETWAAGNLREIPGAIPGSASDGALSAQLRCEILADLADMDWASIDNFYRPPQGNEDES